MNKKISVFIFVGFIAMQILSFLHMAHHDFETHHHDNQICALSIQNDSNDLDLPPQHFYDYVFQTAHSDFILTDIILVKAIITLNYPARAPPLLA